MANGDWKKKPAAADCAGCDKCPGGDCKNCKGCDCKGCACSDKGGKSAAPWQKNPPKAA